MLLQNKKYMKLQKANSVKHERSDKFAALKDELMEHIKAGLNLPEGEEMPDLTKKLVKHLL